MEYQQMAIILVILALGGGWLLFHFGLKFLPYLERRELTLQKNAVLQEAERQRQVLLADARVQAEENEKLLLEDLEALLQQQREDLASEEEAAEAQEASLEQEEKRVAKVEAAAQERALKAESVEEEVSAKKAQLHATQEALIASLERRAELEQQKVVAQLAAQIKDQRQLECQKVLKSLQEELRPAARKRAQRILDRVHARYAPNFVWPKASNVVEVNNEPLLQQLSDTEQKILDDLAELSGVSIKILAGSEQKMPGIIKVAGGYGIYREAARLALADLVQAPSQIARLQASYHKHCSRLEAEALSLGRKAVEYLALEGVHPEIQKLVGALNWRTSYRQNQWYHTVEVAVLAGIIAQELGVCPAAAKRVGLLHDIGKAIDYRIEGSHAVISGDYADRYGESRLICDTVMSHHADLLVETPLAYVLRAADTLSGARPGARVNLEEGYQIRLEAIADAVKSFAGIADFAIMNGGREVHIQVNHKSVAEQEVRALSEAIARRIEEEVAYPGQIKILVSRCYESVSVA